MAELWKDVVGYEGLYRVSSHGRVKSFHKSWESGLIMKCRTHHKSGYPQVQLKSKKGKNRTIYVHRLVAVAFIPNPENKLCVNHIDENRENNVLENLEWVTHKENSNHGTRNKRISLQGKGNRNSVRKPVWSIGVDGKITQFESAAEGAKSVNIDKSNVAKAARENRICRGFRWSYSAFDEVRI